MKTLSILARSVNFNKMMPKAGVFKQSEVFQVLNDQQLKSKAETEKEEKQQWTTFLQKPNRPPPLRTQFLSTPSTYKPMIVKQPKPKCAPDYRQPTPVSENGILFCGISFENIFALPLLSNEISVEHPLFLIKFPIP